MKGDKFVLLLSYRRRGSLFLHVSLSADRHDCRTDFTTEHERARASKRKHTEDEPVSSTCIAGFWSSVCGCSFSSPHPPPFFFLDGLWFPRSFLFLVSYVRPHVTVAAWCTAGSCVTRQSTQLPLLFVAFSSQSCHPRRKPLQCRAPDLLFPHEASFRPWPFYVDTWKWETKRSFSLKCDILLFSF